MFVFHMFQNLCVQCGTDNRNIWYPSVWHVPTLDASCYSPMTAITYYKVTAIIIQTTEPALAGNGVFVLSCMEGFDFKRHCGTNCMPNYIIS